MISLFFAIVFMICFLLLVLEERKKEDSVELNGEEFYLGGKEGNQFLFFCSEGKKNERLEGDNINQYRGMIIQII